MDDIIFVNKEKSNLATELFAYYNVEYVVDFVTRVRFIHNFLINIDYNSILRLSKDELKHIKNYLINIIPQFCETLLVFGHIIANK